MLVLVVIYGDVVFCGQGVVMELFKLFLYLGYSVGGMVYVIVNNQIGFIMFNLFDFFNYGYCIDIVCIVGVLVLYVNVDQLEVVLCVVWIVFDYCMQFGVDVVIDLVGYCCWGYVEQDMVIVIQFLLYGFIDKYLLVMQFYVQVGWYGLDDGVMLLVVSSQ